MADQISSELGNYVGWNIFVLLLLLAARIAALQAAATFGAGVMLGTSKVLTSADVLRVADAFERWLREAA